MVTIADSSITYDIIWGFEGDANQCKHFAENPLFKQKHFAENPFFNKKHFAETEFYLFLQRIFKQL